MKRMPPLTSGTKQEKLTATFLGYNHNQVIMDGEMYDMKNMSGDMYPILTPRKKRASLGFGNVDLLTGIDGRDQLTFVLGTDVYYNFIKVDGLTVSDDPGMCPKQIVNFGAYVLIYPDKVYFNTVNSEDYGPIDRMFSISGSQISLTMCRGDGTDYDMTQITVDPTAPVDPDNGKLWIDQSGDNDVLRQWTSSTNEWVEVATVFVKVSATGIGLGLNVYDAITLSGITAPDSASPRIKAQVAALNGSKIVYYGGENYIVVVGIISQTMAALKDVTVRADRTVPDLDYIVESNNRLWGCKYGMVNGQVVNEIRASSLGDFRNWNKYLGTSQDSYTASVGTDGPFTGAVTQKGYPVFFKEGCIHQLFGSMPSNFQIETIVCRGIQIGSWRSAVVVNERVFYKSRNDIMMFDGSMPVSCSEQLGNVLYSDARAGALGNKYYISMKDRTGTWTLFTYDTENRVWYKEDNFQALGFGTADDELYAICEGDNRLYGMTGNVSEADADTQTWEMEEDFEWMAMFGMQGIEYGGGNNGRVRMDNGRSMYMSRFNLRLYLEEKTKAQLEIQYNDDGIWRDKGKIKGNRMGSFVLPIIPVRCDHLRFRMKGKGLMRVYSISRNMEVGGDGGVY